MSGQPVEAESIYVLETPVGIVTAEANGRPCPLSIIEDATGADWTLFEESAEDVADLGRDPIVGQADGCFLFGIDISPLAVGDTVRVVYDFGKDVIDWGGGEHVAYRVFAKDGYSVCLGVYDDNSDTCACEHAYRLRDLEGTYEIVSDPVTHPYASMINVCVAWKEGVSEANAEIVGWAAFMGV